MSTITKEQLISSAHARIEFAEMMLAGELEPLKERTWSIELELARIALASLEAEPAIHRWRRVTVEPFGPYPWHYGNFIGFSKPVDGIEDEYYYSAPPAPASVPDDFSGPLAHAYKELTPTFMRNHIDVFERYGIYPDGSAGIQAMRIALDGMTRRAAMLQGAEPVTTACKLRDAVEIIRSSGIEIDADKIFAELDALNAPDCWCRTCRPVTISDMRFVVCPVCGNKRCPHANDHRNACTGSNEPGQEGGAYPAAPQQEVK